MSSYRQHAWRHLPHGTDPLDFSFLQEHTGYQQHILDNMPDNTKGSDHIGNIEPLEVPAQNVGMEAYHRGRFQEHYGGSAMMGGGDLSETATASEVSQLARSLQADEMGALNDDHMRRIGIAATRYHRHFATPAEVADDFGPEALQPDGWPARFAERDKLMDNGISVVPGSSRRNNSTVETKLLQETYALTMQDPTVAPEERIELRRRLNESNGIYGIDYEASLQFALEQQAMQMLGIGGTEDEMGAEGEPTGPGATSGRRSEAESGGSPEGQRQGIANQGGGRTGRGEGNMRSQMRRGRKERAGV